MIQFEDLIQHEINKAKKNHEKELINIYVNSKDPKLFHYLKTISKSGSFPLVLIKDSEQAVTDEEKA